MDWPNIATKRKPDKDCREENGDYRVKRMKSGELHWSAIGRPQREIIDLTEGDPLQGANNDGIGTKQDPITFDEVIAISEDIAGALFTELPNGKFVIERRRPHQNDPIVITEGEDETPHLTLRFPQTLTNREAEYSNDKFKPAFLYVSEDEDDVAKRSKREPLKVATSPSPRPRRLARSTSPAVNTPTKDSVRLQESLSQTRYRDKNPSPQPSNWKFSNKPSVTTQCTYSTPEPSQSAVNELNTRALHKEQTSASISSVSDLFLQPNDFSGNRAQEVPRATQNYDLTHFANGRPDAAGVSTEERKWSFWHVFAPANISRLELKIQGYYISLPADRTAEECWLYTGSKLPRPGGTQTLSASFQWTHDRQRHRLTVNMGFIGMLVEGLMTEEFRAGIIKHKWHASHLCGNWTCMNPRHIYPESGPTNWSRNPCFRDSGGCLHSPKCLKHLKRDLSSLRPLQRISEDPSAKASQEGIGVHHPFQ